MSKSELDSCYEGLVFRLNRCVMFDNVNTSYWNAQNKNLLWLRHHFKRNTREKMIPNLHT